MAQSPTSGAVRALQLELKKMQEEPVEGFRISLVNDDNIFEWEVAIFGPPGTLYEGGYFKVTATCGKYMREYAHNITIFTVSFELIIARRMFSLFFKPPLSTTCDVTWADECGFVYMHTHSSHQLISRPVIQRLE